MSDDFPTKRQMLAMLLIGAAIGNAVGIFLVHAIGLGCK